jgi:prepilin-type processing-associated H-X9-DG protein
MRQLSVPTLSCPSFPGVNAPISQYAGVHHHAEAPIDDDNTGVLFLNSRVTFDDLVDGAAYTLIVGEKTVRSVQDLGWMSGTPATLRNTGTPINRELAFRRANRGPYWDATGPPWTENESTPPDPADDWTASEMNMGDDELYGIITPPADGSDENADGGEESESTPSAETSPPSPEQAAESPAADDESPPEEQGADVASTGQPAGAATGKKERVDPYIRRGGNPKAPLKVGGFGSHHVGGANFAYADGSVHFLSDNISKGIYQKLGNRKDGKVVDYGY